MKEGCDFLGVGFRVLGLGLGLGGFLRFEAQCVVLRFCSIPEGS